MKYVCYKTTVSKVLDEHIGDIEDVKAILKVLKDCELNCAVGVGSDPTVERVRITDMLDDEFVFKAVWPNASLRKRAKYTELEYLELQTDDRIIARTKPNVSRWVLLDADVLPSDDV